MPDLLRVERLTERQRVAIAALARSAASADGVAPLSEQVVLDVRAGSGATHLLGYAGAVLAGYAQVGRGAPGQPAVELVVHPTHRRRGLGRALVAGMPPGARLWAHGDLPAARAFAAALDLRTVRELHVMALSLDALPAEPVGMPRGFAVRTFRPGVDDADVLATNAAAFAGHPEQGRLTAADLRERMAQPWFDPAGLLLVSPTGPAGGMPTPAEPAVAAFHWTKIEPDPDTAGQPVRQRPGDARVGAHPGGADVRSGPAARVGEVYVVAVHPAYQGVGLGPVVTRLGLQHLRARGCEEAVLYVDADNAAAMRTYLGLGLRTRHVDRMLALPHRAVKVRR